jgi:hypothetical protein
MSNRTYFIIRSLLQNSNLNRENFVNSKKKYNLSKSKQGINRIITRKFHTNSIPLPIFGKGPGGNGPKLPLVFILFASLSGYISSNFNKNSKN